MRRDHLGPSDGAHAAIGREDDNGREGGLEGAVEVCEALNVQHVHLVDKEDARHKLGDPLVNVLVDDLVDLRAELLGDLRLLWLHHLPHHAHQVLPALRLRVGQVEVVQSDILHDLLALVHVALWQRDVLLRLEIVLGREGVRAADTLHRPRVGLDIDHIARRDLLLLERLCVKAATHPRQQGALRRRGEGVRVSYSPGRALLPRRWKDRA